MRVYTATVSISALAAAKTLLYITAPANKVVKILETHVTNTSNTTNDQERVTWQRISSLGTPTATTLTPSEHDEGDPAAGSTVKGNVTASEPTYASNTEIGAAGFATLSGYHWEPHPDSAPIVTGGQSIGLRLTTTPAGAFDADVTVIFGEIG